MPGRSKERFDDGLFQSLRDIMLPRVALLSFFEVEWALEMVVRQGVLVFRKKALGFLKMEIMPRGFFSQYSLES